MSIHCELLVECDFDDVGTDNVGGKDLRRCARHCDRSDQRRNRKLVVAGYGEEKSRYSSWTGHANRHIN